MKKIVRLGHLGDGVDQDGQFVPFTLPGEIVASDGTITNAHPGRITPVCRHFQDCGGCTLQHAQDDFLADWKQEVVERALDAHGLRAQFRPVVTSAPGSRRRAVFAARRTKKTVQVGFHRRGSDQIVELSECHLVLPDMLDLFETLQTLTGILASRRNNLAISVTHSTGGWDVEIRGAKPLSLETREAVVSASAATARVSVDGEVLAMLQPPAQIIGPARVVPPPGAFLQATEDGEAALQSAVRDAVGDARKIIDLFSGCGTLSLPLIEQAEVHAVESVEEMLASMDAGWREVGGLKALTTDCRDLFRRPVLPQELEGHDAVIIDPPRAGAEAQMTCLAEGPVNVVASVSCNPVTFARDAKILVEGGFTLDWVQVVDQFRWSPHIEVAARFSRLSALANPLKSGATISHFRSGSRSVS